MRSACTPHGTNTPRNCPEACSSLSIAQSVICEPKILLLDEPFSALDPGITAERLLVFDKKRHDPQAPEVYGATVTYDIPLQGNKRMTEAGRLALAAGPTGQR